MSEHFAVKHYTSEEGPVIKGNGFDGLRIGEDREEAEDFVNWVNARLDRITQLEGALSSELNPRRASDMAKDLAHEGESGVSGALMNSDGPDNITDDELLQELTK